MSSMEPLLQRNREFAASGTHTGLSALPRHPVFVISCFDPRVDPAHILGIELGDAVVIRNAGGRVTEDVILQIAILATMAEEMVGGTPPQVEVAIIHHTKCGTQSFVDPAFREALNARTGSDHTQIGDQAVTDPAATVAADVEALTASPSLPDWATVSGYVYDVTSGLVTSVDDRHNTAQTAQR